MSLPSSGPTNQVLMSQEIPNFETYIQKFGMRKDKNIFFEGTILRVVIILQEHQIILLTNLQLEILRKSICAPY